MNIRERIILPLQLPEGSGARKAADVAGLLLHLLLFDTVIIPSIRLGDIANVARTIGVMQTVDLLQSGAIQIRAAIDHIAGANPADPEVVQMIYLWGSAPEITLSSYLKSLHGTGPMREVKKLKLAVVRRWIRPSRPEEDDYALQAIAAAMRECYAKTPMFIAALQAKLQHYGVTQNVTPNMVSVEQIDNSSARIHLSGVVPSDSSRAVREACLALADLNAQFGRMKRDQAVMTLHDDSVALMGKKLEFIWSPTNPGPQGRLNEFCRIVSAAGLPDFSALLHDHGLNVERFLDVRASAECQEFRAFLRGRMFLNEKELAEIGDSLRSRVSMSLTEVPGNTMRLIATTAATRDRTEIPADVSNVATAIDSFIAQSVLSSPGIVTFLGEQYPSIFRCSQFVVDG